MFNTYFNELAFYDGEQACYRATSVEVTHNGTLKLSTARSVVKRFAWIVIRDTIVLLLFTRLRTNNSQARASFLSFGSWSVK